MNVYDEAHRLADSIEQSEEYKQYHQWKLKIDENPELAAKLAEFQKKQMESQAKQMMGEQVSPEVMQEIQEMYQVMMQHPEAMQYLEAAMRFSIMMSDVYKIVGESLDIGNGINL